MTVRKTLCRLNDLPDGGASALDLGTEAQPDPVIVLRQGDRVFAYRNECPHTGRRLDWAPGKFLIDGNQLICAAHGACFYIESGRCFAGPARGDALASVAVEVVDGDVILA
jgi:nitrite reductase/ring-hydroxylating ferredoxin subunit